MNQENTININQISIETNYDELQEQEERKQTLQKGKRNVKMIYSTIALGYFIAMTLVFVFFPKVYSKQTILLWFIIFNILFYLIIYHAYITSTLQPEIIPQRYYIILEENKQFCAYCPICQKHKAERVHHCHVLNKCIYRYDHYCTLLGNTIGYHNYKNFVLFQMSVFATVLVGMLHMANILNLVGKEKLPYFVFILAILFVINICIAVTFILIYQLVVTCMNMTMIEFMNWMIECIQTKRFVKPRYYKSIKENLKDMLHVPQNRCVLWGFLPLPPFYFEKELQSNLHDD